MQTTLLSFAIALILALLAALLGPYVIRWNDHRAFFEAEASRIVGVKVRVGGDIDAAILPTPSVTLRAIAIGPPGEDSRLRARSLRIELALGPLMRGELRATEMKLVAPQINIGLDAQGQIDWPALAIANETLSIDKLSIEDAYATLTDVNSKTKVILDKLWFAGEVRSLTGPIRGRGNFVTDGKRYGYDVSAGRQGADGIRLKLGLKNDERPLAVEAEGTLTFDRSVPRFDGALMLSRPAGVVLPGGKTATYEPWRLTSKIKASEAAATLDEVSFQYGPDEQAVTLTGAGEFKFGLQPQLQGALTARQLDVDRLLATPETPRRVPFAALQALGDLLGSALRPSWPVKLALNIDAMTLGGASVQNVASEVRSDGSTWMLDKLEFRAPGFTQVKVDGRLYPLDKSLGFAGGANIDSNDPKNLLAWLGGRTNTAAQFKPWHLKGDITLGSDRIAVQRLRTEFDRGAIEGSVSYAWPADQRPARLEGELRAAELDLDGVLAFGSSALSGMGLERPGEIALAIDVGRARIAGFDARDVAARLSLDANGLAIERLSVADLGDMSFAATGRIDTSSSPGGNISVTLDARDLRGLVAVAERFTPALAEPLRKLATRQKTAALRANVSLADSSDDAVGKIDLNGQVGAIRVNIAANATGKHEAFSVTDLGALAGTDVRLDGKFEADSAGPLLALIGLDRLNAADDKRAARLDVSASGPLSRELRFEAKLATGAIDAGGSGTLRLPSGQPAALDFDQFAGSIAGSKVQGRLALRFGDAPRIDGAVEADALDAPAVVAAAIGMPARSSATNAGWSSDPIAWNAAGPDGRIEFKAQRATLASWLTAQNLRGAVRFSGSEVAFENVAGELGNGRLEASLAVTNGADGLAARLRTNLASADLGALFPSAGQSLGGRITVQAELEGSGRSPAAFIGSLKGSGSITLEQAQLAGLNPDVFGAVTRAVELGIPTDGPRIREFVKGALNNARMAVPKASASIGISAGQAHLRNFAIKAEGAELEATANLNLSDAMVDALFTLNGAPSPQDGARPAVLVSLNGALPSPQRTIDTNLLTGWLTLRSLDQRAKQVDVMEQAAREASAAAAAASAFPKAVEPADGQPADAAQPPAVDATSAAPAVPESVLKKIPGAQAPIVAPPLPPPRIAPRADGAARPPRAAKPPQPALLGAQN